MGRRPKERNITEPPVDRKFKPGGKASSSLEKILFSIDEFEAIRLADHEGFDHEQSALRMGISRTTFTRLLERARHKMACMLVESKELVIEGGAIHFTNNIFQCSKCGNLIKTAIESSKSQNCTECGSVDLIDMAQEYGHGPCCKGKKIKDLN